MGVYLGYAVLGVLRYLFGVRYAVSVVNKCLCGGFFELTNGRGNFWCYIF